MKLLIATDYYEHNATNGAANKVTSLHSELQRRGIETLIVSQEKAPTSIIRIPRFENVQISQSSELKEWYKKLEQFNPDIVWIMTEEQIGYQVRWWCLLQQRPFHTQFTTKYPEFFDANGSIGCITYDFFRFFHEPAEKIHVPTASIKKELLDKNFANKIVVSPHGTDTSVFTPEYRTPNEKQGYALYLGRLAPEKNVEALLHLDTRGRHLYVVGNGRSQSLFDNRSNTTQLGPILQGKQTAKWYANADVTIFPSLLDTFGLVITESLACGTPVAAFDVAGPRDILTDPRAGVCADNLQDAFDATLHLADREFCRQHVVDNFSVEVSTDILLKNLTL